MTEQPTHTEILTPAEASILSATMDVLAALDRRAFRAVFDEDAPLAASALGRVAALADSASDAIFAVLNNASSYGRCVNAEAAIRRRHATAEPEPDTEPEPVAQSRPASLGPDGDAIPEA